MKYTYIYVILGICAVAVSMGKALAVNFGISKYLSKKSYNGKFKVIKTASISFGVGYIFRIHIIGFSFFIYCDNGDGCNLLTHKI